MIHIRVTERQQTILLALVQQYTKDIETGRYNLLNAALATEAHLLETEIIHSRDPRDDEKTTTPEAFKVGDLVQSKREPWAPGTITNIETRDNRIWITAMTSEGTEKAEPDLFHRLVRADQKEIG